MRLLGTNHTEGNIVFKKMFKDSTCVQGCLGFEQEFERLWLVVKDAVVKRCVSFRCSLLQTVAVMWTSRWWWVPAFWRRWASKWLLVRGLTCSDRGNPPRPESSFPPDAQQGGEPSLWFPSTGKKLTCWALSVPSGYTEGNLIWLTAHPNICFCRAKSAYLCALPA